MYWAENAKAIEKCSKKKVTSQTSLKQDRFTVK